MIVGSTFKPEKHNIDFIAVLDMVEDGMYNKERQDKETLFNDKSLMSSPPLPSKLSCPIAFKGI